MSPETCPICGADVPSGAKACPECGADEDTGWSEEAYASGLGLPDSEPFDHERFVREEFGKPIRPKGIHWFWWIIAILVLVVFAVAFSGLR